MKTPPTRRQRGFTLLEVLVAFAIMALSLGLMYRSLGSSADATSRITFQQQSTQLIQSLLQSRQYVGPQGWAEQGQTDALKWIITSRLMQDPSNSAGQVQMYEVTVTVSSRQQPERQTRVQTLRPQAIAPNPAATP